MSDAYSKFAEGAVRMWSTVSEFHAFNLRFMRGLRMLKEIKPALSAEQWETQSIDGVGATAECLNVGDGFDSVTFSGERRHALAALALHGQPFGFTHEDVALLRKLDRANDYTPHDEFGIIDEQMTGDETQRLRSLAKRIAALLPPDGT